MFITASDQVRNSKLLGIAVGVGIKETSAMNQFMSNIKDKMGGNDIGYEKVMQSAIKRAITGMIEDAESDGADGVINVQINNNMIIKNQSNVMIMATAYGTEVKKSEQYVENQESPATSST